MTRAFIPSLSMAWLAGWAEVKTPTSIAPPFNQATANTTRQIVTAEDPMPPCPSALTRSFSFLRHSARHRDSGFSIRAKRDPADRLRPFMAFLRIQITGPIVDGFRIHQQMEATMAAERAGKGLQDTSTMTVPTTGALPDGPLPSGWVPGGFPTRKV